jgi:hypothetical protein
MEPLTDKQLEAFWPMVTPEAIYNAMPRETKERLVRQLILRWAFEAQKEEDFAAAFADLDDEDFGDFDEEPEEYIEEEDEDTDFVEEDESDDEDEDVENRPFYI